jgi:hypothetical protein
MRRAWAPLFLAGVCTAATLLSPASAPAQSTPATLPEAPSPADVVITARTQAAEDWSRFLPVLYPGLIACLAAHPSPPAYAVSVIPMNRGLMAVHTVGVEGAVYRCTIATTGGAPVTNEPIPIATQLSGPSFTPADLARPAGPCIASEPVTDRAGKLLGWVAYTTC